MKRITVLAALSLAGLVACGGEEPTATKKSNKELVPVGKKSGKRAGKAAGKADSKADSKPDGKAEGKSKS